MRINSQLKEAQLDNKTSDVAHSPQKTGLIWLNTTLDKVKCLFNNNEQTIATEQWVANFKPVGAVELHMLTEAQLQNDYGDRWIMINGQVLPVANYPELASRRPDWVSGSDIQIPSSGDFFRVNSGRALGSFESDEFGSHNHGGGGSHTHKIIANDTASTGFGIDGSRPRLARIGVGGDNIEYRLSGSSDQATIGETSPAGTTLSSDGGSETRPKNIAINAFIKVK